MSKMISLSTNGKTVRVAEIKKEYIKNIIKCAEQCREISRIMLFGSSIENRCKENSDVDIAVFGDIPKGAMYKRKSYNRFLDNIYSFDLKQDYDVLYFTNENKKNPSILSEVEKGVLLYERA